MRSRLGRSSTNEYFVELPTRQVFAQREVMTSPLVRLLGICFCVALGAANLAVAAEPAIIAKARAALASDAVLDAVKSIHYRGTLSFKNSAEPAKELRQQIEIFLEKPAHQRIVVSSDESIEVTALDGYDAWRRTSSAKDTTKWQQSQMSAEQIKQLRADVWENLAFFRGIEREGGRVEEQGTSTVDGVPCVKVAFYHSSAPAPYFRFFNASTGKLVLTGTPENNIREEGELVAGGIRFPKTLVITQLANGQTLVRRITFEAITVNESFPANLFSVPLPTLK